MADISDTATHAGAARPEGDAGDGPVSTRDRFGRLTSDVQDRYRRLSEDVRRGAERASGEIRRTSERAREQYQSASSSLKQGYERARSGADDVTRQVSSYVRENPGKSVLIAAGVGFLLGLVLRGRDRGEDLE